MESEGSEDYIISTEDNFLGGFATVRIKTQFPFIRLIINFTQIVV